MKVSDEETVRAGNRVVLTGRLSSQPVERVLSSGDRVVTFRLVMPRERSPMTAGSSPRAGCGDCWVWGGRGRRGATRWQVGDLVELEGALRRRFFRSGEGTSTRVEVEVLVGRRRERAG